ncbi:MAG: SDR family NAD(P)-dependent oxidoreductase [Clostridia bacterium]|nr:SDR family NAD(P)-dependent oxidoreductase [Clostridia bacterium]
MKDIIVVTGASSGLGKEFVLQIDKKEKVDEIWVIARRLDKLIELQGLTDAKIVPIALDLSNYDEIKLYENKLSEEKPNVKILVNCAGFGKFDHYENVETNVYLNMIDLNCKSTVLITNLTLPFMTEGAKIVNFASFSSFQPVPYINVYGATKAFTLSYSRALNRELAYRKIKVLAVCPLWVKTEFFDRAIDKDKKPVVISYNALYTPDKIIKKAIKDLYKNKDMSIYGKMAKLQWITTKILPHKLIMKIWLNSQKLDGTKDIRKD